MSLEVKKKKKKNSRKILRKLLPQQSSQKSETDHQWHTSWPPAPSSQSMKCSESICVRASPGTLKCHNPVGSREVSHFEKSITEYVRVLGSGDVGRQGMLRTVLISPKIRNQGHRRLALLFPSPHTHPEHSPSPQDRPHRALFLVPQTELIYNSSPIPLQYDKAGGVSRRAFVQKLA